MSLALPRLPSRLHAAAALAAAAAVPLLLVRPWLALLPLLALALLVAAGPYFPAWALFLPIARHGPRTRPEVALTFDDGPDPRTLPHLLRLLAEAGIPATFFLVGRRAAAHPEAVRALLAAGHELGNHSDTHDVFLATRSAARLRREVEGCQAALAAHGVRPLAYRPPVGITSPPLRRVLRDLGLRCVAWSCRPVDFGNRRLQGLAARVLRRVRPGDVVLLHDLLPQDGALEPWLAEMRRLLAGLAERGLRPVALSRLLGHPVMEAAAAPGAGAAAVAEGMAAPEPPSALDRLSRSLTFLFTLAYPLLVAGSLAYLGARWAALVLLGLHLALRLRTLRRDLERARGLVALAASVALLLLLAAILDDPRFLLAYPTLVNAALLANFAGSLRTVPIAERFARLETSELTGPQIRYCRNVTLTWCAFFVLNGGLSTALALQAPRTVWAIYTGAVSYALVGLLFAAEYVVRKARWGRFGPGWVDRTLARLLGRAEGSP